MPDVRRGAGSVETVGIGAGVTAGLVWGLAFLLPELLRGWTAVALTTGRYLAYGAVSLALLAIGGRRLRDLARRHWRRAAELAVTGNIGYYLLAVVAVQAVGAAVTALVIGSIPVVLAAIGNWTERTYEWRRLAIPVALVASGLLVVNLVEITMAPSTSAASTASITTKLLGLVAAAAALSTWVWYGIANARFLAAHPEVPATGWSTIVGAATGAGALLALPLAAATGQLDPVSSDASAGGALVAACLVLGIVVSWAGTGLWNAASARLPTSLAGMLVVVETVAGFGYVYVARLRWPPALQLVGFCLVIGGVLLASRLPAVRTEPASGRPVPSVARDSLPVEAP